MTHLRIDDGMYITVRNRHLTSSSLFVVVEKHAKTHTTIRLHRATEACAAATADYTLMADIDGLRLGTNSVLRFANTDDGWICADRNSAVFRISTRAAKIIDLPCFLAQRVAVNGHNMPLTIESSSAAYISRQLRISFTDCSAGSVYIHSESRIGLINSHIQLTTRPVQRPQLASEWQQARAVMFGMSSLLRDAIRPPEPSVDQMIATIIGHSLLAPVTDDTVPAPLARAQTALDERASRLRQLAAIKGFVRAPTNDLLAWIRAARPQLVARIAAHDLTHAVQCAADSLAGLPVTMSAPASTPADATTACALCCERLPAIVICAQCRSGIACEECTDRLVLETRAECPFCRAAMCAPAAWIAPPP